MPASAPAPTAATDHSPGSSASAGSRATRPAACITAATTLTGLRQAAMPPAKGGGPEAGVGGRANATDFSDSPLLLTTTDSEVDGTRTAALVQPSIRGV